MKALEREFGPGTKHFREARRRFAKDERQVLRALRDVGVRTKSVHALVEGESPAGATRVLVSFLEREDLSAEMHLLLGNCLARTNSRGSWSDVKRIYREAAAESVKEGAAIALAGWARKVHFPELVELVSDPQVTPSAVFFLRPIRRFGGSEGAELLASLLEHPVLGPGARQLMRGDVK